jgi:hypothetical protein
MCCKYQTAAPPHCPEAALLFCNADFDIQGKPGSLEIYQLPWSLPDDCSDFSQHCIATKNPQEVQASCQR